MSQARREAAANNDAQAERPAAIRISRDYYRELIRDSQLPRAGFLAERERWLRSLQVDAREELLFEFEMLLRAIERGFNLHNLSVDPDNPPVVTRDFREELLDVRDAIDGALRIARALLDPDTDQKLVFRKYVETRLVDDRARRRLLEEELDQDSPQESLFVLRQSFEAIRVVIDALLELPAVHYPAFTSVGDLALREIFLNRFFRPFRPLEFRIEYDRLHSVAILEALRGLPELDRGLLGSAFLALFRLLHYLSYGAREGASHRRARVALTLVRSEANSLVAFLKDEVAPRLGAKARKSASLRAARDIAREGDRILKTLLADANAAAAVGRFTALFEAQIVALAGGVAPALAACDFDELVSPIERAERLRKDLWVLAALSRKVEGRLRGEDAALANRGLESLRAFLTYFQDVSYQLLRYADYEVFDHLISLIAEAPSVSGPAQRQRLAEDLRDFGHLAEATFAAVSRRSHLKASAFDRGDAETLLSRFAAEH